MKNIKWVSVLPEKKHREIFRAKNFMKFCITIIAPSLQKIIKMVITFGDTSLSLPVMHRTSLVSIVVHEKSHLDRGYM